MSYEVTIRYADGAERRMPVKPGESVLEAADANGVPVVSECQSGVCGTCVGRCTRGEYEMSAAVVGLSRQERDDRRVLACQTYLRSDCEIEVDYPLGDNAARLVTGEVVVARVERLSPETALLVLDVSPLPERPGASRPRSSRKRKWRISAP